MLIEDLPPGPDPDFPWLGEYDRYTFPDPGKIDGWIVAAGGNLSPGMLLSAYEQGIFPWFNPEDPVLWQSPDPRYVIFPDKLHSSRSMEKVFKRGAFEITFNKDFPAVISGCADTPRKERNGTWITDDIKSAYTELHRMGYAHSAEAWSDGVLAGGCYGTLLGKVFFGESMFSLKPNASKAAFITFARYLFANGIAFVDCQIPTAHLQSLGGEEINRKDFLFLVKENLLSSPRSSGFSELKYC